MRIQYAQEECVAQSYDPAAAKKPMNLSINSDLQHRVKLYGVNASAVAELALAAEVQRREREAWLENNRESIEDYNRSTDGVGLFSDGMRSF